LPEAAEPQNDFSLDPSIPAGAASLESILCTEELRQRPSRRPDHAQENAALVALASALAESRHAILEVLADTILRVTGADSSGLSLLTSDGATPNDEGQRFYWPAIKGMWSEHVGGVTPRNFAPSGEVLDRNCTLLFRHFERRYLYLLRFSPAAEECLLVPFYVRGKAVGTIWAMMHSDRRKFDSEDQRLMSVLGQFASLAYQTMGMIDDFKAQIKAREEAESRLREMTRVEVAVILDGLEAQVRTTEEFHRVVVETASDTVVSIDHGGYILFANRAATRTFGYEPSELIGQPLTVLMPEYLRDLHKAGLKRYQETSHRHINWQGTELIALRKNGEEFPVEVSFGEINSDGSRVFTGFIRDISERKRAEEKLRESELNLRQMTETIPEMLWGATPDGSVDYCNTRVLDYTGLSQREIQGAGWMKTIHPDDAENVEQAWARSVESGDPFYFEFRGRRASDGKYRWCVSRALPLRTSAGGILRWHGTVVDFHDRRQAQEDLRNAQAELAHVNRVMTMGELTASIAHEVNQPLASIVASGDSCTAWLAHEPPNLDKARAAACRIIQAATQASETVQRLRALFKKTTSITTSVDVNIAIEDTVSLVRHEAQRNKVVLRTELEPGVPSVRGDRVQLQQVILNLTMNGIESVARLDHEPRWVVIRSANSNTGEILISVEDTGLGIEGEQADRLFAPFFTTKPQGIGMGLPICRSIIEAHGGRLWAAKNQPRGAVFHFAVPVTAPGA